jgi:hypothetical protein
MSQIPKEILLLIISFMDDSTRINFRATNMQRWLGMCLLAKFKAKPVIMRGETAQPDE